MKTFLALIVLIFSTSLFAQFDGAAGTPGSLAIHRDSSAILAWANTCQVERGWLDISNKPQGLVTNGLDNSGAGAANGIGVVSLGDSGVATLAFNPSIANGPGPDFAVFENSFSNNFLELAFVEVSSNGVDFYRFPAVSNFPAATQIGPFDDLSDPTLLYNLAGKYRSLFGTPFDLSELDSIQELNINQITHVRIIDVVGSVNPNYGSEDKNGNLINDPFPTNFFTGGFDLDGIAVLNQGPLSTEALEAHGITLYPNPLTSGAALNINSDIAVQSTEIYTVSGSLVYSGDLDGLVSKKFDAGAYFVHINTAIGSSIQKLIVRD
jgi:hypothetical protein